MDIVEFLHSQPWFWMLWAGITGLIVGSFLNVVILRLPVMMEREWRGQCAELAGQSPSADERFDLAYPPSRCPHCQHRIAPWHNVPVLSYLLLKGQCRQCHAGISARYPIIEAVSAVLSVIVAWRFGFGWAAAGALVLTWALIALTVIDLDHQLLPDSITLPFLWLGLLVNLGALYAEPRNAILGAVFGYLILWSVYKLFKWITGKEGMGYGDFKLLAMLGAWLGWLSLPLIILLSSLVGAVVGVLMIVLRGRDRNIPIPFGPYLAAAGWIALLWGQDLTGFYLSYVGHG